MLEFTCNCSALSKYGSSVAPGIVIDNLQSLLKCVSPHNAESWPKDLLFVASHICGDIINNGGTNEIAVRVLIVFE